MNTIKIEEIKIVSFIPMFFKRLWLLVLKVVGSRQDVLAFVAVIFGGYMIAEITNPMWRVISYVATLVYIAIYQKLIKVNDVDVEVNLGSCPTRKLPPNPFVQTQGDTNVANTAQ